MKDTLDFIIIGAQKSGTTSFFKYLEDHPRIAMPSSKEAPYFTSEYFGRLTWNAYANANFAATDKLWGKVTPHHMCDAAIPKRIHDAMPDVKLIALLRNPINRAYSHYQMAYYKGWEKKTFQDVIRKLSTEENQIKSRALAFAGPEVEILSYLTRGEYGRILSHYLQYFSRDQILIFFTEELSQNPKKVLNEFLQFVDLPGDFAPKNLSKRYRVGGSGHRYSKILKVIDKLKKIIPFKLRLFLEWAFIDWHYWFEEKHIVSENKKNKVAERTRHKLTAYFNDDVSLLSKKFELKIPWADF